MASIFRRAVHTWKGFDRNQLPAVWKTAVETFTQPGGSAEDKLGGPINTVDILDRGTGNPVHKSHFNRADKEDIISAKIEGSDDTKTCHIYSDGTGTTKKGDTRA